MQRFFERQVSKYDPSVVNSYYIFNNAKPDQNERLSGFVIMDKTQENIVIVQENDNHQKIGLPKGRAKDGESDIKCAMREVYEETGINLSKQPFRYINRIYNTDGTSIFLIILKSDCEDIKFQKSNELNYVKWAKLENVKISIMFSPYFYNSFIKKAIKCI